MPAVHPECSLDVQRYFEYLKNTSRWRRGHYGTTETRRQAVERLLQGEPLEFLFYHRTKAWPSDKPLRPPSHVIHWWDVPHERKLLLLVNWVRPCDFGRTASYSNHTEKYIVEKILLNDKRWALHDVVVQNRYCKLQWREGDVWRQS